MVLVPQLTDEPLTAQRRVVGSGLGAKTVERCPLPTWGGPVTGAYLAAGSIASEASETGSLACYPRFSLTVSDE